MRLLMSMWPLPEPGRLAGGGELRSLNDGLLEGRMMGSGCRFQPIANVAVRPILFAVGMRIAAHPPHRSEQALFTHSAPTSGV